MTVSVLWHLKGCAFNDKLQGPFKAAYDQIHTTRMIIINQPGDYILKPHEIQQFLSLIIRVEINPA